MTQKAGGSWREAHHFGLKMYHFYCLVPVQVQTNTQTYRETYLKQESPRGSFDFVHVDDTASSWIGADAEPVKVTNKAHQTKPNQTKPNQTCMYSAHEIHITTLAALADSPLLRFSLLLYLF